jgi:hypothetical protein
MPESRSQLSVLLNKLSQKARSATLTDTQWAALAGVRKETLSRLQHRATCDFATLSALAAAVGMRLEAQEHSTEDTTPDGHFPTAMSRDYEQQLIDLCASGTLDTERWASLGASFFMAGLAVMVASVPGYNRRGLLALAEHLHPGASEPTVFARWLERSPVRPSRFLPLLKAATPRAA